MKIVDLDKFYDRKEILDLLKKRILDLKEGYRQNIAFLGNRYIGKTIILQKFISDLQDIQICPVYLDLENKELDAIFEKITGGLLFHCAKIKKLPLRHDVKSLLEESKGHIPHTHRAIKRIYSLLAHHKSNEAFREMILLPQIYSKEMNVFCVLFMDEFHSLQDLGIPNVFQELGKKIMTQKRCLYVVTSSFSILANNILSEKLSLLFGNFEVVHVHSFDLKTSCAFIDNCIDDVKISDPIKCFLVDFTGGHPLFLRLICQELGNLCKMHQQKEIFIPLVQLAIENVLFNPWGVLSRHFDLLLENLTSEKGHNVIIRILSALTEEKYKLKELTEGLGLKQSQVLVKLNYLIDHGVVLKNGSLYYLADKLMRFWLKFVFQIRQQSFDFNPEQRQWQFRRELEHYYENFKINAQKDFPTRIMELLYCFDKETLHINGRRYRLPVFRKVTRLKMVEITKGCMEIIRGISESGEWFFALKAGSVNENDINLILKESRKSIGKPRKHILISPSGIDDNTRLKALQERMWVWSEGELSTLLHMFNKPFIPE